MIRTEHLTKSFGDLAAVVDLNLDVAEGEIFGLVGPDGAGKTTTMRLLTAIMDPTAGDAWVAGQHVVREAEAIKEDIGYMSQRFGLYADLTVMENLDFYADIYNVPAPRPAGEDRAAAGLQQPDAVSAPAGGQSLRRHETEARPGLRLDPYAQGALPRRADQRRRSRLAPRFLADPLPVAPREGDDLRFHGLSRRGRALQSPGADPPRQAAGLRHARRGEEAHAGGDPGGPHRRAPQGGGLAARKAVRPGRSACSATASTWSAGAERKRPRR